MWLEPLVLDLAHVFKSAIRALVLVKRLPFPASSSAIAFRVVAFGAFTSKNERSCKARSARERSFPFFASASIWSSHAWASNCPNQSRKAFSSSWLRLFTSPSMCSTRLISGSTPRLHRPVPRAHQKHRDFGQLIRHQAHHAI